MTDRELLELAAKAAGIEYDGCTDWKEPSLRIIEPKFKYWNPLTDDGDALRLAVKLGMMEVAEVLSYWLKQDFRSGDPYAATRRAIVRAAAEIGREMK